MANKRIFAILLAAAIPVIALAADPTFLGGPVPANPADAVNKFYGFALAIGGLLAFGAIVWGGIRYTFAAGNPSGQTEGKEWIKSALWGLLLLGGAYLILNTISPKLTTLALPELQKAELPPSGGAGGGGGGGGGAGGNQNPPGGVLTDAQARSQLAAAGINIKSGVSLANMRQSTVDELVRLKGTCGCDVTVTSGVEGTHGSRGTCSHANGYKADIRPNDALDNFIKSNYPPAGDGIRHSDNAPQYRAASGAVYARESNHWDMVVGC